MLALAKINLSIFSDDLIPYIFILSHKFCPPQNGWLPLISFISAIKILQTGKLIFIRI